MKKEKLTLQEQLARRKFKKPNKFLYNIYRIACKTDFLGRKYNPKYNIIDDVRKCDGPCFIIWNHQSRFDHIYVNVCAKGRPVSILAGYNEFFRSHLHTVFKYARIIPKKIFSNDVISMRGIYEVIQQNGCIAFSPEGTVNNNGGVGQPIIPGTGRFLKFFKIPVYFVCVKGGYLTSSKENGIVNKGEVDVSISLLFSKDDLNKMTNEEVEYEINKKFYIDDFEYQKEKKQVWKLRKPNSLMEKYDRLFYRCPICGEIFITEAKGNEIYCPHCGKLAHFDKDFNLVNDTNKKEFFSTPNKWCDWERGVLIKEIRSNPNYEYKVHVKLGYLPSYHYPKHRQTSELCGEGEFTINHEGVSFKGTKLNKPFEFFMNYKEIYSLVCPVDHESFGIHIGSNAEYHEFITGRKDVYYMIQLVEEMHRLHVNTYKNYPWLDYLYPKEER